MVQHSVRTFDVLDYLNVWYKAGNGEWATRPMHAFLFACYRSPMVAMLSSNQVGANSEYRLINNWTGNKYMYLSVFVLHVIWYKTGTFSLPRIPWSGYVFHTLITNMSWSQLRDGKLQPSYSSFGSCFMSCVPSRGYTLLDIRRTVNWLKIHAYYPVMRITMIVNWWASGWTRFATSQRVNITWTSGSSSFLQRVRIRNLWHTNSATHSSDMWVATKQNIHSCPIYM